MVHCQYTNLLKQGFMISSIGILLSQQLYAQPAACPTPARVRSEITRMSTDVSQRTAAVQRLIDLYDRTDRRTESQDEHGGRQEDEVVHRGSRSLDSSYWSSRRTIGTRVNINDRTAGFVGTMSALSDRIYRATVDLDRRRGALARMEACAPGHAATSTVTAPCRDLPGTANGQPVQKVNDLNAVANLAIELGNDGSGRAGFINQGQPLRLGNSHCILNPLATPTSPGPILVPTGHRVNLTFPREDLYYRVMMDGHQADINIRMPYHTIPTGQPANGYPNDQSYRPCVFLNTVGDPFFSNLQCCLDTAPAHVKNPFITRSLRTFTSEDLGPHVRLCQVDPGTPAEAAPANAPAASAE